MKIQFYADEHPPPHFHARFAEFSAQIAIASKIVLNGSLPVAKRTRVLEWASEHEADLLAAWQEMRENRKPRKIG